MRILTKHSNIFVFWGFFSLFLSFVDCWSNFGKLLILSVSKHPSYEMEIITLSRCKMTLRKLILMHLVYDATKNVGNTISQIPLLALV